MNRLFLPLLSAALFIPSFAYGETFENEEAWSIAVTGEVVPTNFGSLIGREVTGDILRQTEVDGELFAVYPPLTDSLLTFDELPLLFGSFGEEFPQAGFITPQSLPWGELTAQGDNMMGIKEPFVLEGYGFRSDLVVGGQDIELSFNPDLGQLSGVSFRLHPDYIRGIATQTEVKFLNGDEVVDSLVFAHEPNSVVGNIRYVGWTNTENLDVTRILITFTKEQTPDVTAVFEAVEDGEDVIVLSFNTGLISDGELAFAQVTTAPSNQELLDEILIDVGSIPATGNQQDDRRIARAIDRLNNATDPDFWEDDDTLSNQGRAFFRQIDRAIQDLSRIRPASAEVEQAIEDLDSLLEGIVDAEIAEATANGGRQNFLNAASSYQEFANLYASAGLYQFASRLRFWAWYLARIS